MLLNAMAPTYQLVELAPLVAATLDGTALDRYLCDCWPLANCALNLGFP